MPQKAFGAFVLFGTNFLAIQFAATLVFLLSGIEEGLQAGNISPAKLAPCWALAFSMLTLLAIVMTRALSQFVERQRLESYMRAAISIGLRSSQGAQLDTLQISNSRGEGGCDRISPDTH